MASPSTPLVQVGPFAVRRHLLLALTAWSVAAVVTLYVLAPPAAPGILVGCLLPPIVWCLVDAHPLRLIAAPATLPVGAWLAPLGFVAWMALSVLWSPDPRTGLAAVAWCAAVLAIVFTVTTLAPRVSADARSTMARAFVFAFAFSLCLLLWDALTDLSGRRLVMSLVLPLRPDNPDTVVRDGWVTFLPYYMLKKNVAVVMVLFWPALIIGVRYASGLWQKRALLFVVAFFAAVILISGHDSSRVALAVSGGLWILAVLRPTLADRAAAYLWLAATLAIVPLAVAAYQADLHKASFIQYSGRHRIVIWERTAENVLKAPIRGAGVAATRTIDETSSAGVERPLVAGTDIPDGVNVHSHNIFLQTWHELGAIGALLLAASGWPMLVWIRRRDERDRPYFHATFAAVATIASLSWSMLAAWFVATFGIVAIFAQLAALAIEDRTAAKR